MIEDIIKDKYAKPDKTIKQHTDDLLEQLENLYKLGYIKDVKIYDLTKKACLYHDIGKINKEFQKRVKSSKKVHFNVKKEVSHNILSIYFIDKDEFGNEKEYLIVVHAVLNHHDYCDVFDVMREKKALIKDLISDYDHFNISNATKSKVALIAQDCDAIKIKGYLHKCDYAASGGYVAEYENDFLKESLEKLLKRWQKRDKKANWNELQQYCIENKDENIIVVAQTGMGKTEAGLHWIGNTKGFFILPIRTAINAIYDRVVKEVLNYEKDKLDDNYYNQNKQLKIDKRVAILHSNSLEHYSDFYNPYDENKDKDMEEKEFIDIVKYEEIGKNLSIPLNISTMDQLFDFVYKYKGFELKLTTLSYSKIVIDEIQMYGPDLLAYLIYGLEQVVSQGGKVAILTATLPPFIRELLSKNIDFKYKEDGFINDSIRHNLKVLDQKINAEDIADLYNLNKEKGIGNKILVVCNTVKEAQNIYKNLKEILKDEDKKEINLLHSKFIKRDRAAKEKAILEFGRTYKEDKKTIDIQNGIWISTSIVEASLDIDFDYLFTELQDLSSLFQRLGRCNRKAVKNCSETNCYVYTEIDENLLSKKNDKGDIFIDETIFNLSKEAISTVDGKISERQKVDLIEKYLTMDNLKHSNYMRKYNEIYKYIRDIPLYNFKADNVDLRNILSVDVIPSEIYEKNQGTINECINKLNDREVPKKEKIKFKKEIENLLVSVSPWDVSAYRKALRESKATTYNPVRINSYQVYPVIECDYEELGYVKKNFKEEIIRDPNLL